MCIYSIIYYALLLLAIVLFAIFVFHASDKRLFIYTSKDYRICKKCGNVQVRKGSFWVPYYYVPGAENHKCKCNEYLY